MVDNKSMELVQHASVEAFFHEVVTDALASVEVSATEPAEWYLVGLLGDFAHARITDEPLAMKLAGARDAEPGERVRALKEVGDTTLYLTGFFSDSLHGTLVDPDYYIGLGTTAYRELAGRLGTSTGSASLADVYQELAAKFPRFVDVLADVRKRVDFVSGDVVKLYQRWLVSRDEWVERRLRAAGMIVDTGARRLQ
jgi:hypothetical protein